MARPKMTDEQKAAAAAARAESKAAAHAPAEGAAQAAGESLEAFIAEHERDDVVLVRVWYPGAKITHFDGRYSGIAVEDGPKACQFSDGSTV